VPLRVLKFSEILLLRIRTSIRSTGQQRWRRWRTEFDYESS